MEKRKNKKRESPLETKLFDNDSKLIFTSPMAIGLSATTFYSDKGTSILSVPGTLVKKLVASFDGHKALKQIKEEITKDWDEQSIDFLIGELIKRGLLVDSYKKLAQSFDLVANPQMYPSAITKEQLSALEEKAVEQSESGATQEKVEKTSLMEIMSGRESWRDFSMESITEDNLRKLLWCAFGRISDLNSKRTFPSAGGLYPTKLSLVLLRPVGKYTAGIYEVVSDEENSVGLIKVADNHNEVYTSYLDPTNISRANGVFVVNGSIEENSKKYGNRSMLYTVLEAGHIAQNFLLSATEQKLAAVELGGYYDRQLAQDLHIQNGYKPLVTIAFGVKDENPPKKDEKQPEVFWSMTESNGYRVPFTMAMCRISKDLNEDWSYGRDVYPEVAKAKAISEAKEWASCGCVPENLLSSSYSELTDVIDPTHVIAYSEQQLDSENFPFERFDENEKKNWVQATRMSDGKKFWVLADLVYLPYFPEYNIYGYANSSGVAAHPDSHQSVESGALELVERDSFMNSYLSKIPFPTISNESLTTDLKKRVRALEERGFNVVFKDQTIDMAPVVFVYARNDDMGYMTCASCCKFDFEKAASHALMEVESSILARFQNGPSKVNDPEMVYMPADHGGLYEQREHYRKADFLVEGGKTISLNEAGQNVPKNWDDFMKRLKEKGLEMYTVPLELSQEFGGNGNLTINRTIIPGLVPLTFGKGLEPGGVQRIYEIAKKFGMKVNSFEDLTHFPHPFA